MSEASERPQTALEAAADAFDPGWRDYPATPRSTEPFLKRMAAAIEAYKNASARPDRSWWPSIYRAGIDADLKRQLRQPPDHLTDEQKHTWLAGYDR